jgi:hypothetical protein
MLAALASWGFTVGDGVGAWLLGIAAPLLIAVVWTPQWRRRLVAGADPTRVVIELVIEQVLGVAALAASPFNASCALRVPLILVNGRVAGRSRASVPAPHVRLGRNVVEFRANIARHGVW